MRGRDFILYLPLIVLLVSAGCSDDTDVTLAEPGVYKGGNDELLQRQASPAQQADLRKRLEMVQTDR